MIGKFIVKAQEWADERLRRLAGRISPDMRVAVILVMLVTFGALSVYMTVTAICHIGRIEDRKQGMGYAEQFRLRNDSIINPFPTTGKLERPGNESPTKGHRNIGQP